MSTDEAINRRLYRSRNPLDDRHGRRIEAGLAFPGSAIGAKAARALLGMGIIARVSAPPLSVVAQDLEGHIEKLRRKGIRTIEDFAVSDVDEIGKIINMPKDEIVANQRRFLKMLSAPGKPGG